MDTNRNAWQSPLISRYTSPEMLALFSDNTKFTIWRTLWISLAKNQKKLGLSISDEQIDELLQFKNIIDYDLVAEIEAKIKHDVTSHIRAYAKQCPKAGPIIHYGATSCFATDNTDLYLIRSGIDIVITQLAIVIRQLSIFADSYKATPCLGYTHLKPAQPVTVGKRACMWLADLLMDIENLQQVRKKIKFLGSKGATGTQASFMKQFNGDISKVRELDKLIAADFDFEDVFAVTGQTYSRKLDTLILETLSGLAETIHKICFDLRLLQSTTEIEEPFGEDQVGSSAMAYKRNPMYEERACSLARHSLSLSLEAAMTHMTQLFERTLDDSAGRRIYIAESFLTTDALLRIMRFLTQDLVVYPEVIHKRLMNELPFMATEEIIMAMVSHGASRQECHEKIRVLSQKAGNDIKIHGQINHLMEWIKDDEYFQPIHDQLKDILNPERFIEGVPEMVSDFLRNEVSVIMGPYYLKGLPQEKINLYV